MPADTNPACSSSQGSSAVGENAEEGPGNSRRAAADRIADVAWKLEGHAEELPGGERVAHFAHVAADKLTGASDYLREHDLNAMLEDARTIVKNNPLPAMVGAATLGFLLGRVLSRD